MKNESEEKCQPLTDEEIQWVRKLKCIQEKNKYGDKRDFIPLEEIDKSKFRRFNVFIDYHGHVWRMIFMQRIGMMQHIWVQR